MDGRNADIPAMVPDRGIPGILGAKAYLLFLGLTLLFYLHSILWERSAGVAGAEYQPARGLYLVGFVFFVGASAGAIVLAVLARAPGAVRFRRAGAIAGRVGLSSLVMATGFLVLLERSGYYEGLGHLFATGRSLRPLMWDAVIIGNYLGIAAVLGYVASQPDLARRDPQGLAQTNLSSRFAIRDWATFRVLVANFVPAAVLLHSVPHLLLELFGVRHGWESVMMAPLFAVSGMISGLALVILAAALGGGFSGFKLAEEEIWDLGRILLLAIPLLAYGLSAEMLALLFASGWPEVGVFWEMVLGRYGFLFWFAVIGGLVVPSLLLLLPGHGKAGAVGFAAWLVTLGIFAQRWNEVILPLWARTPLRRSMAGSAPGWPELSLSLLAVAAGMLLYVALARFRPPRGMNAGR